MKKRKIAECVVATPAHLAELIEEATVDCGTLRLPAEGGLTLQRT